MQLNKINKKSQAEMITIVLLIILSIAAVIIVWNIIHGLLNNSIQDIGIDGMFVDGELEYYIPDNFAIVKIKRGNDNINISGIKILFTDLNGANYIYNTTDYPNLLETKRYIVSLNQLTPDVGTWTFSKVASISFVYLFPNNKMSSEIDKQNINKETNMSQGFDERCLYNDTDGDGYGTGTCTQYYSASNGKTPLAGDCNDANVSINPGAGEICDNGIDNDCDGLVDEGCPDYVVTSTTLGSYWIEDCSTGWQTIDSFPTVLDLDWNFKFYTTDINQITVCKQGHISIDGNCYTGSSSPIEFDLSSRKMIAPSNTKSIYASSAKYCKQIDNIIVRWTISGKDSEAMLNKNGKIDFSYSNTLNVIQIGVSNGLNKHNQTLSYGTSNQYDYSLQFS